MTDLVPPPTPPIPPRHPGGRTCRRALPLAIMLTAVAMARHWRDLPTLWRETKDGGSSS